MTEDERRAIEWDCQQLLNRVTTLLDEGRWHELAECYSQDAILARPSDPDTPFKGRQEILESLLVRPPRISCHILSNCLFDVISPTQVEANSRVMLISATAGQESPAITNAPILIGSFCDQLQKINGRWMISQRMGTIEIKYAP